MLHSLVFPLPPSARELKHGKVIDPKTGQKTDEKLWDANRLTKQQTLEEKFVDVASQCHAVVCCRVSPLQKAQVRQGLCFRFPHCYPHTFKSIT